MSEFKPPQSLKVREKVVTDPRTGEEKGSFAYIRIGGQTIVVDDLREIIGVGGKGVSKAELQKMVDKAVADAMAEWEKE